MEATMTQVLIQDKRNGLRKARSSTTTTGEGVLPKIHPSPPAPRDGGHAGSCVGTTGMRSARSRVETPPTDGLVSSTKSKNRCRENGQSKRQEKYIYQSQPMDLV